MRYLSNVLAAALIFLAGQPSLLLAVDGTSGNDNWTGTSGDDVYNGLAGDDIAKGLAGSDTLNGGSNNDRLVGDTGEDTLNGDSGNDTLVAGEGGASYSATPTTYLHGGDNSKRMSEWMLAWFQNYTIIEALTSDGDTSYVRSNSNDNTGWGYSEKLYLRGFDFSAIPNDAVISGIEIKVVKNDISRDNDIRVLKANGQLGNQLATDSTATTLYLGGSEDMMGLSLTAAEVKDPNFGFYVQLRISGDESILLYHTKLTIHTQATNTDDSTNHLSGGTGNDELRGSDQSDRYYYNIGDGIDTLYEINAATSNADRLIFGTGISPNDVWFKRTDNPMDLSVTYLGNPIIIKKNWYLDQVGDYGLDHIEFSDGTVWNRADYYDLTWNLPQWGTEGDDTWNGNELANEYDGRGGNDIASGQGGDDLIYGGTGNDTINGNGGADTISGEDGNDTINGGDGNDFLSGNLGQDTLNGGPGDDTLSGRYVLGAFQSAARAYQDLGDGDNDVGEWTGDIISALSSIGGGIIGANNYDSPGWDGNTDTLRLKHFDFSELSDTATVTGVGVYIRKSSATVSRDTVVRLRKASGTQGTNVASLNETDTDYFYGGPNDMMGLSLTPADLKNSEFALDIQFAVWKGDWCWLDYVEVVVFTSDGTSNGTLYDSSANTLTGGPGNDLLIGTSQNETYIYNIGDGSDRMRESSAASSNADKLLFGQNILPGDISFGRLVSPPDLQIKYLGQTIMTVEGWYTDAINDYGIDLIEFDDGTQWDRTEIINVTWALSANGGENDDIWYATSIDDLYNGNGGDDQINAYGYFNQDQLNGGDGNDLIVGSYGGDTLSGDADNDMIHGELGADTLNGGAGDDILSGRFAYGIYNSTASGYQDLDDGDHDVYAWTGNMIAALSSFDGSGVSALNYDDSEWGESKTIRLNRFDFSRIPDDASITGIGIYIKRLTNTDERSRDVKVRLRKPDGTFGNNVAKFSETGYHFFYGGPGNLMGLALTPADVKSGDFGVDLQFDIWDGDRCYLHYVEIVVYTDNASTFGENLDDAANQYLGGPGNDYLLGTSANDTFTYNQGDGIDTLYESTRTSSQGDRLVFGPGILPPHISFETPVNSTADLLVKVASPAGGVLLKNWFVSTEGHQSIESIEFDDGTIWDLSTLNTMASHATINKQAMPGVPQVIGTKQIDHFVGSTGDDVLGGTNADIYGVGSAVATPGNTYDGGAGNDTLNGTTFGDTYFFNSGDGSDTIVEAYGLTNGAGYTDKLVFGSGLLIANLSVTRTGNDLLLSFSTGESVTVQNWFISTGYHIEEIEFADSTIWTPTDVLAQLPGGTDTSLIWADTTTSAATTGRRSSGSPVTGVVYSAP